MTGNGTETGGGSSDSHLLVTCTPRDPWSTVALTGLLVTVVVKGTAHIAVAIWKGTVSNENVILPCRVKTSAGGYHDFLPPGTSV